MFRQSGFVAAKLGVVEPPQTVAELKNVLAVYRPELKLSPAAKEAAEILLKDPPLAGAQRFGYAILAAGAVSTLPTWARRALLLPVLPTHRPPGRPAAHSVRSGHHPLGAQGRRLSCQRGLLLWPPSVLPNRGS
jgi:hypothetical protein